MNNWEADNVRQWILDEEIWMIIEQDLEELNRINDQNNAQDDFINNLAGVIHFYLQDQYDRENMPKTPVYIVCN